MDPNANLGEQIRLAARIITAFDEGRHIADGDAARLAELVHALDQWIRTGGFVPVRWQQNEEDANA